MTSKRSGVPLEPFDVVIAGAGLAGGSLALRLARAGLNVAVLDASRFPRTKICGEFLSPECWDEFDQLGLTDAITRLNYQPIHRVRISTPRGREVTAAVVGRDQRPGIGLSRLLLDDLLLQAARQAGATVLEATRVVGPILDADRVAGVLARSSGNELLEVRAAVTVAADGRQSTLVRQTGTTWGRSWFRARLFGLKRHLAVTDLTAGELPGTVGLHLVPGGYGGTCRIEGDTTNLCALLPETTVRARRGDLDRVAAECLGINPALRRLITEGRGMGPWKTVAGVQVQLSRPRLPGIFFAGDGQGTVDPLGGQGMTMALLGSAELASFVRSALAGDRAGATPALQTAWEQAWKRRFDRRIHLCRAFHHFLILPALTDMATHLGPAGTRFLSACYGLTRDRRRQPAQP